MLNLHSVNMCSVWRMALVIRIEEAGEGSFDPPGYSSTIAGLANVEAHLALACAALPVFWPILEERWNRIVVTREVSVTTDYGQFPTQADHVEMQSTSSDTDLRLDAAEMPEG